MNNDEAFEALKFHTLSNQGGGCCGSTPVLRESDRESEGVVTGSPEVSHKKLAKIKAEAVRRVEAARSIQSNKGRMKKARDLQARQAVFSASQDAKIAMKPIRPSVDHVDARAMYVLLYKVLLQHANPAMTTPETADPLALAGSVRKMGEVFGIRNPATKLRITSICNTLRASE